MEEKTMNNPADKPSIERYLIFGRIVEIREGRAIVDCGEARESYDLRYYRIAPDDHLDVTTKLSKEGSR